MVEGGQGAPAPAAPAPSVPASAAPPAAPAPTGSAAIHPSTHQLLHVLHPRLPPVEGPHRVVVLGVDVAAHLQETGSRG